MSARSRKQTETSQNNFKMKRAENSWVFLVQDKLFRDGSFEIVTLPHPSTNKPSKYCLSNDRIYEIMTYDEPCRSWFIGETVKSDASMQIITPVNPLFLILPKLKELCNSRAVPLEDLLSDDGYDKILNTLKNLDNVADLKGPKDLKAYKYNETKTLDWLESRVRKLAKVLKDKNIHVTSGAASATFITSSINQDYLDNEFYIKFAHEIISEYLQDDLIALLKKKLDIKPEIIENLVKKRKSEVSELAVDKKRSKCNSVDVDPKESFVIPDIISDVNVKKSAPLTAKEKSRQKAASGTKTISSFFKKS